MEREKLKILLVEDVYSDAELNKAYLSSLDFDIDYKITEKRKEFSELLDDFVPDIILSDFNLPTFDGLKALDLAKEKCPNTPFIFVTGTLGEEAAVEAIKSGASDFLIKGKLENLPAAVLKALREAAEKRARIEASEHSLKVERRFKALIENSSEGVVLIDEETRILYISPAVHKILGFAPEEAVGKIAIEFFIHPQDIKMVSENLGKVRNQGNHETFVSRAMTKGGNYIWIEVVVTDQRNVEGVNAFVINYRDVSEKVEAQQKLEYTLQNLETMVEERTAQLKEAHSSLEHVHSNLEEAHGNITDSINYAKRIQQAILFSEDELLSVFPNAFVLYKPRDIVSGDFYWVYEHHGIIFLAVVDCTGHGVPGALMSMIGNEVLDHIIIDRQITRPDVILEEMDKSITRLLSRNDGELVMSDGMDMSLCTIDYVNKRISFAGAHNSGILISNGKTTILKASKNSIGGIKSNIKEFGRVNVSFSGGEELYLFSDGFHDQFGGANDKKFMKKNFYDLIGKLSGQPFQNQKMELEETFNKWKGHYDQLDDVTVVGVKL